MKSIVFLLVCVTLIGLSMANPILGQEQKPKYGGRTHPGQLLEMQNMLDAAEKREHMKLAVPRYKDLVDLWAAGRLTVADVLDTKEFMPPEWYVNLMKLAICPSGCKFLTTEEMMDLGYPQYLWGAKPDDMDMSHGGN